LFIAFAQKLSLFLLQALINVSMWTEKMSVPCQVKDSNRFISIHKQSLKMMQWVLFISCKAVLFYNGNHRSK